MTAVPSSRVDSLRWSRRKEWWRAGCNVVLPGLPSLAPSLFLPTHPLLLTRWERIACIRLCCRLPLPGTPPSLPSPPSRKGKDGKASPLPSSSFSWRVGRWSYRRYGSCWARSPSLSPPLRFGRSLPTSARTDQKVWRVRSGRDSEGRRESGKKARDGWEWKDGDKERGN